jgi:3-hydroxyacyl-[acyl-carrier-protein] dehydratase
VRYLLVDRIEEVVPGSFARGAKNVAMSEDYLEWHFPGRPVVPGTLVLEMFAQLAGWHEAVASGFRRWFLLDRVASARYFGVAVPGDRIDLRVEVVPCEDAGRRRFRGESAVGDQRKAVVEFEGVAVPLEDLDARERVEQAWRVLQAPAPAPKRAAP